MRSRPDPRPRLAPLRRSPAPRASDSDATDLTAAVPAAEPELGGWVPVVDRAPTGDDLLSEWAPRPRRGRRRTGEPTPEDDPPVLRLVPADHDTRPDETWSDETWSEEDRSDDVPSDETWPEAGGPEGSASMLRPADPDAPPGVDGGTAVDGDRHEDGDWDRESPGGPSHQEEPRVRAHRINGRWGRFAELWVPESMREARVDPGRRGMLVLVLVAAVAAVVAAVGVWRDRPEPRPVETAVIATASGEVTAEVPAAASPAAALGSAVPSGTAPGAAAAGAPPAEILVSVTGLVTNPGVVRLAADARVADAIAAAGGTQSGADLTGMNLAAKLADGDSVVVTATGATTTAAGAATGGSTGAGAGDTATAPAGGLVNLNTADEAALDTLPGVGPVMAQNILAWRQANGRFATVEQLQEISGIGPSRFAQLAPLVTVG